MSLAGFLSTITRLTSPLYELPERLLSFGIFSTAVEKMNQEFIGSHTINLFRRAKELAVPSTLMIPIQNDTGYTFQSVDQFVIQRLVGNFDLVAIFKQVQKVNNRLTDNGFINIYNTWALKHDKKNRMQRINDFYRNLNNDRLRKIDAEELENILNIWQQSLDYQINLDKTDLENLEEAYVNMDGVYQDYRNIMKRSPFHKTDSVIEIKANIKQFNRFESWEAVGLDIFDKCQASMYMPLIIYNSESNSYFKILDGDIRYQQLGLLDEADKNKKADTIYMLIWNAESGNIKDANKNQFHKLILRLKDKRLEINIPSRNSLQFNQESIIERIRTVLPFITFDDIFDSKIKGYVDLFFVTSEAVETEADADLSDRELKKVLAQRTIELRKTFELDEVSFSAFLLDNLTAHEYMRDEERSKPSALKEKLEYKVGQLGNYIGEQIQVYNSDDNLEDRPATVSLKYYNFDQAQTVILLEDGQEEEVDIDPGEYWFRMQISAARNNAAVDDIVVTVQTLICLYSELKAEYRNNILNLLDLDAIDWRAASSRSYIDKMVAGVYVDRNIDRLRAVEPKLFAKGYAKECSSEFQPKVIDNLEEWTSQTFTNKSGREEQRRYIGYPQKNPKTFFGCPNDRAPYPVWIANNNPNNKSTFPLVPCCSATAPDETGTGLNKPQKRLMKANKREAVDRSRLKTDSLVAIDQVAALPKNIEQTLQAYEQETYHRYGVAVDANSAIRCICRAIGYEQYNSINVSNKQRDAIIIKVRSAINKFADTNLVSQEMFDYSSQDIRNMLKNYKTYLDPTLFYRVFEEFFKINIFIFSYSAGDVDTGSLVIPRHKAFPVHITDPERKTIILYRHIGSASDRLEFPHHELIIQEKNKQNILAFGLAMTTWLNNLNDTLSTNITLTMNSGRLENYNNVHNMLNYPKNIMTTMGGRLYSQFIDAMGKCQGITIEKELEKVKHKVTFILPPSMPMNIKSSKTIYRVPWKVIYYWIKRYGWILQAKTLNNNQIAGVWISLDNQSLNIYVPITAAPKALAKLRTLPIHPLDIEEAETNTLRYNKIIKTSQFLMAICKWLLSIFKVEYPMREDENDYDYVTDFLSDTFELVEEELEDSVNYYDFSNLPRFLPEVKTLDEALDWLPKYIKPMVNGKIKIYSQVFLVGLNYQLSIYNKIVRPKDTLIIADYYRMATDFKQYANNLILISRKDFNEWKSSKRYNQEKDFSFERLIPDNITELFEPLVYIDRKADSTDLWMIQNPLGLNKRAAIAISVNWQRDKVNTGKSTLPQNGASIVPPIVTYSIANDRKLYLLNSEENNLIAEQIINGSLEEDKLISLIMYSENQYGALLSLQN